MHAHPAGTAFVLAYGVTMPGQAIANDLPAFRNVVGQDRSTWTARYSCGRFDVDYRRAAPSARRKYPTSRGVEVRSRAKPDMTDLQPST